MSVDLVCPPHVHQPRVADWDAAVGSPAHVPSFVGVILGILTPSNSFIHSLTCCESNRRIEHGVTDRKVSNSDLDQEPYPLEARQWYETLET